ncbi:putative inositol monophosphatase 3 [Phlebotomus papatasi]|uniref:putative inositol monophosphatase 3 n=1 Tax=Phlebotomus papatasi TaxID=29031 RepID=UPI0024833912|nr:putative inositol monophosphatase 3 [Phlebotomus papatasi]
MNLGGSIRINKCGLLILFTALFFLTYYVLIGSPNPSELVTRDPNSVNLRKLLIGAIQAAEKGGVEVVTVSKSADFHVKSKGKTAEGANNPVTEADFKSHCVMQFGLHHIFPRLRIISEEDSSKMVCPDVKLFDLDPTVLRETLTIPDETVDIDDVTVWIDPLDATQEYTEHLFEYVTTMVCVAIKGKPTIGVIHNPFTQKTTWAWAGVASSEDLHRVKKEDVSDRVTVIVSRSHTGEARNFSRGVFGENMQILTAAGAGYKVLQIISGNATAYLHTTAIKKWDICAGDAILRAVDGKMTNLFNEELSYGPNEPVLNAKGLLAAFRNNHEKYIERIIDYKANKV